MKKRILSSILTLFLLVGTQFPAEAKILIKDGIPQDASVNIDTYIADKWSTYPDYHVQNADPSIWASQLDTGRNSNVNCVPATTKMLLNMKGLMKEKSVNALGDEGLREVNNYTMLDYLRPYGYIGKLVIGDSELLKKYIDWGNVITVPTLAHQRLCIGYATKGGKTWFEVLDPAFYNISEGHQWIEAEKMAVGFPITDTMKVKSFVVDYKDSKGNSKQAIAYYNNIDYYLPKSMINEMLPETLSNEDYFKQSILPTMNYESKVQDQITNVDKVLKQYMYIGGTVYQAYEFTKDSKLQKENNTIIINSNNNGIKNAA